MNSSARPADDAARTIPLPIDRVLPELVDALRGGSSAVLRAATGAGKTTRVPPAVLDAGLAGDGRVLVLQPRRVAARAAAARMAAENGWTLGGPVGYRVRFEARCGPATRIEVVTEGILLQRLLRDPFLSDIGLIVFDEFHERNLSSDLALGMVRQIQQTVRPELKLVVMSATLDTEPLVQYLGDCPAVTCDVRRFPVQVSYRPPLERRPMAELAAEAVQGLLDRTPGDVLVFLPGLREIQQTRRLLAEAAGRHPFALYPLYGDLPSDQQDAVLGPCGTRKVILSTNVAETSLTIEGITAVVDTGWARQLRFDPRVGLDRLQLVPISRAAAEQRAGRAGRTGPGQCIRLWHEAAHAARPECEEPEIRRVDLSGAVLQLAGWIEPDLQAFPWFQRPRTEALDRAASLLQRLEAVDRRGITRLGRRIAALPVPPRLGRLLIEGQRQGCEAQAALGAALLAERSPFARAEPDRTGRGANQRASSNDLLDRINALLEFERTGRTDSPCGRIHPAAARFVLRARDQLLREIRRTANRSNAAKRCSAGEDRRGDEETATHDAALGRALLAAFPDRLARRRAPGSPRGVMVGNCGVRLADQSGVVDGSFFLCLEVDSGRTESLVRCAAAVPRWWLPARHTATRDELFFDPQHERVSSRRRVYWEDLLLEESSAGELDKSAAAAVLAEAAGQAWPQFFPRLDDGLKNFVLRVRCLRAWIPELVLPELDDAQLEQWLPALSAGRRSFAELRQAPWLAAIQSSFPYEQLQAVQREAPEHLTVPSGRRIALRYEEGRPPVLAVRIQELFGWAETPRIARGRIRVLLHLLAPNLRTQQITDDLRSFWDNVYPTVRKQLRGRYPKHPWPEDPWTASPTKR
jgi:ATP-dependent helicase HrpB